LSILFDDIDIMYKSHNAFILVFAKLCGPLENASWPTTRPWPIGWKPLACGLAKAME